MLMDADLIKRVEEITLTDYEPYNTKNENTKLVINDNVIGMIEDLLLEIDRLDEQIENMREFYEEHYQDVPEPDPDVRR